MEYPMITCIGGRRDTLSLYSVVVHELAHMWFPMQVGSDEKRYAWQDEGLTRFNQAQGMREFFRGYDREAVSRDNYLALARAGGEVELMRHGDLYPLESPAYAIASYDKMATNLVSLRGLVGDRRFREAYREYGNRWRNRHPSPWDFWNTFNDVLGVDLSWFWRTWWFETWTMDQAVTSVQIAADSTTITIEDRGLAPMPTDRGPALERGDRTARNSGGKLAAGSEKPHLPGAEPASGHECGDRPRAIFPGHRPLE
jgi:aminopeptidase N